MTSKIKNRLLKDLQEVKKILSNNLNEAEVEKLMTANKSFCIKSLVQKELNSTELSEVLLDALAY